MAESTRPARDSFFNAWTLLGVALLAAWFPICRPYLRIADDFHFATWLLSGGVPLYFHEHGVWRILGHELGNAATLVNPHLPGIICIATHGIGALLFLAALRQLLVSESLALLLALVFAVFPWGDTALMWACEYTYLLSTTFFLAVLALLLRAFPLKNAVAVPLCVVCAALSLFSHEALFFALLASGGLVFLREDGSSFKQRFPLAVAPVVGCFIWWALYKIYPGSNPPEHIRIHPRTLLSGVYYQYTNLWIFAPWRSSATRDLIFFGWSPWQFAAGLVLLCLLILGVRRALAPSRGRPHQVMAMNATLLFLMVLLVAAVAIYSIGGGFSLDSRKKYPIIPVLLMVLGFGIERFFPRLRINSAAVATVLLLGIATTWLQIGLWRYEVTRLDMLVDFLRTQREPLKVQVEWDSRIQAAWPKSNQFWGAPVEPWVLANALELKSMLSPGPVPYAPSVAAVKFDPAQFAWEPATDR